MLLVGQNGPTFVFLRVSSNKDSRFDHDYAQRLHSTVHWLLLLDTMFGLSHNRFGGVRCFTFRLLFLVECTLKCQPHCHGCDGRGRDVSLSKLKRTWYDESQAPNNGNSGGITSSNRRRGRGDVLQVEPCLNVNCIAAVSKQLIGRFLCAARGDRGVRREDYAARGALHRKPKVADAVRD